MDFLHQNLIRDLNYKHSHILLTLKVVLCCVIYAVDISEFFQEESVGYFCCKRSGIPKLMFHTQLTATLMRCDNL